MKTMKVRITGSAGMIEGENRVDDEGNPAGGDIAGEGFGIYWQSGPLGRGVERLRPNGAFVEDIIRSAISRLRFFNKAADGKFECSENKLAIWHLAKALRALDERTKRREEQLIEGTHAV